MKNDLFITIILIALLFACKKNNTSDSTPSCVSEDIVKISNNENAIEPIVNRYIFQEKTVYLIDDGMGQLDSQSKITDSNCNELGYLGGMMGNTKINGEDFFATAIHVKTVWKK
jgi:hypothetical protein